MNLFQFTVSAVLGSTVLVAVIKEIGKRNISKREYREKLINEFKFFLSKIGNMGYDSIGEFRSEMTFKTLENYLSEKLVKEFGLIRMSHQISDTEGAIKDLEKSRFQEAIISAKAEVSKLERDWLA